MIALLKTRQKHRSGMNTNVTHTVTGCLYFFGTGGSAQRFWTLTEAPTNGRKKSHGDAADPKKAPKLIASEDPSVYQLLTLHPVNDHSFRICVVTPEGSPPLFITVNKENNMLCTTCKAYRAHLFSWGHEEGDMGLYLDLPHNSRPSRVGLLKDGTIAALDEVTCTAVPPVCFTMRCPPGHEPQCYFLRKDHNETPQKLSIRSLEDASARKKRQREEDEEDGSWEEPPPAHIVRTEVKRGLILLTQHHKDFASVVEENMVDKDFNCLLTEARLGPPGRVFTHQILLSVKKITSGERLRIGVAKKVLETPAVPCKLWPERTPYYHGTGAQNAGPPALHTPYNMLRMRPCPTLGEDQYEVVAAGSIPAGTVFVYGGEVSQRLNSYSWETSQGTCVVGGSILRYVNMYFGFAKEPNAVLVDFPYYHTAQRRMDCTPTKENSSCVLCIATTCDIGPGELVLVDSYGRGHDFDILRKKLCNGKYLPMGSLPKDMILPGMSDITAWCIPNDVVLLREGGAKGRKRSLRLLVIEALTPTVRAVPLQAPESGVRYSLVKGRDHHVSLSLLDVVLLIEGADYEWEKEKNERFVQVSQTVHCTLLSQQEDMSPPPGVPIEGGSSWNLSDRKNHPKNSFDREVLKEMEYW